MPGSCAALAVAVLLASSVCAQHSFLEAMNVTKGITDSCAVALAKLSPHSEQAREMEAFSGQPRQALSVLMPHLMKDIRAAQDEAVGIGKFLFRPQIWSRGAPDSCLYLEGTKFCNIDLVRRTSSWGVCIPHGCHASDVRKSLFSTPVSSELSVQADIICVTASEARAQADVETCTAISVMFALLVVSLASTWLLNDRSTRADAKVPPGPVLESTQPTTLRPSYSTLMQDTFGNKQSFTKSVLRCFSISESWASLVAPPRTSPFLALEAIRVLSIFWTILGHVMYFTGRGVHWTNHREALGFHGRGFLGTFPGLLVAGFFFAVDSFLFISAFLAIYPVIRELRKQQGVLSFIKAIPKQYLRRYLRLTPAYAMTICVFTFVSPLLVDGVRRPQYMWLCENCKRNWWQNVFYVNNILSDQPMPMCYPVTWFLALLFQLQLLGPWFGLLAAKLPRFAVLLLTGLCITSWWLSAHLTETRGFRLNPMDTRHGFDRWANEWYTKPWTRAPSYLLGCLFGMLWYYHGEAIKSSLRSSLVQQLSILSLSLTLLGLTLLGAKQERAHVPSLWPMTVRQLYVALSSSGWCVGFGSLLILIFSGPAFGLRQVFEHPGWSVYGRLVFSMYLLHATVLHVLVASQAEPQHFTTLLLLVLFAGATLVTLGASLPLFLLVERPFSALSDLLLRGTPADKAPAGTTASPSPRVAMPEPAKADEETKDETAN